MDIQPLSLNSDYESALSHKGQGTVPGEEDTDRATRKNKEFTNVN